MEVDVRCNKRTDDGDSCRHGAVHLHINSSAHAEKASLDRCLADEYASDPLAEYREDLRCPIGSIRVKIRVADSQWAAPVGDLGDYRVIGHREGLRESRAADDADYRD